MTTTTNCSDCQDEYQPDNLVDGLCVACHLVAKDKTATAGVDPHKISPEERRRNTREALAQYHIDDKKKKKREKKLKLRPSVKPAYQAVIEEKIIPAEAQSQRAAEEAFSRQASRKYLLPFIERFDTSYSAGWFHKDLCKRLEQFSQDVADKKSPRLMLYVPPRAGKSITSTKNFPAWHLGHHPDHEFIITSYASQLALKFSRGIREIIDTDDYRAVFPRTKLKDDSKAAENWLTTSQGGLLAAGVGGPLTGNGSHVAIIDDPVKNAAEADSPKVRDSVWEWYLTTFYTRLAPGGGILLIMCLTGETPVSMADGTEKRLDKIRVGDVVKSYDGGELVDSRVTNVTSQGRDNVYAIRSNCGNIARANARHPFLVQLDDGSTEWVKVKDLKAGMQLVSLKGATTDGELNSNPDNAVHVSRERRIGAKTQTLSGTLSAITASIKVRFAQWKIAMTQCLAKTFAVFTTEERRGAADGFEREPQTSAKMRTSNIAMASPCMSGMHWLNNKVGDALSAISSLCLKKCEGITGNFALTTATTQVRCEDSSAMSATSLSVEGMTRIPFAKQQTISKFTLDKIKSITADGIEEVFDIEVENTHNFLANGFVVSNTRWHHDDLAGRLIEAEKHGGDKWDVVKYPAIAMEDEAYRRQGDALHPQRYDIDAFRRIRKAVGERTWWALYQQEPTPEEGDFFSREHIRFYTELPPLHTLKVYTAWDLAIGQKQQNDFTVGLVAGIDHLDRLYLIDVRRGKYDSEGIIQGIFDVQRTYKPQLQGIEKGHIEMAIGPFLRKRMREEHLSINLEPLKPGRNDKIARARPVQGRMKQGMVYLPKNASWIEPFIAELIQFPNGAHDDQVDAFAWLGQMFDMMSSYKFKKGRQAPTGWRDRLAKEGRLRRKTSSNSPMAA